MDDIAKISFDGQLKISFEQVHSCMKGLGTEEANARLKAFGVNELAPKIYRSIFIEALSHLTNPLIAILLIASIVSAFTGQVTNALIMMVIILLSAILDYIQTHRSLVAAKELVSKVAHHSTVLRDGIQCDIPSKKIVPGDILFISAGDLIPADGILIEVKDLHILEATLTGESLPVEKYLPLPHELIMKNSDKNFHIFSGTSVVSGHGRALVLATGKNTQWGSITQMLTHKPQATEFEKGLMHFSLFIMKTISSLVLFVFLFNVFRHHPPMDALMFAMALAVGLTPEFLPMITTVTLSAGAIRMAKKNVIVKNLAAIQNFGGIDILCSDKTGTLTKGQMILEKILDLNQNQSEYCLLLAYLNSVFGTGIQNPLDTAILQNTHLNPLDLAILEHQHPKIANYKKIDEIPFDFERRIASVVVSSGNEYLLISKGAPEQLLEKCHYYEKDNQRNPFNHNSQNQYHQLFQSLSREGYKVLAVAYKPIDFKPTYSKEDEQDLIFSGFLIFADPIHEDARESLLKLKNLGVKIKILTGDNPLVARHVCQKVGIPCHHIIKGEDLEHISSPALAKIVEETDVFARLSPMQKQRIIATLRTSGHIIGYLGDGINDAPSLHTADVGISVEGAVDVAKEAADIILLKHQLGVLINGIVEGRKSYGNIMKYLMMGTSSNFGNMLSMALLTPLLPFFPMQPMQILLNNLLYDIAQVTIPTDNVDEDFIRKPKHWDIRLIKRFMLYLGPISSLFDGITFYVMLSVFKAHEALFQTGWFVESLATQILVIFIIRTLKNPLKSKPSLPLTLSVFIILGISIFIPFSPIAPLLGFTPLPPLFFAFLILASVIYLSLVEWMKKKLFYQTIDS